MKRRGAAKALDPGRGTSVVEVPFDDVATLVTLENPSQSPEDARGGFARLQVPEGLSGPEVDSWRRRVATVARAVRVVSAPRSALLPLAAARPGEEAVSSVRDEILKLAKETGDEDVLRFVEKSLAEAERVINGG